MESSLHYIAFDDIGVTFVVVAAALSFVVLAWNAVKAIQDWRAQARKPTDERIVEVERREDDHERRIKDLEDCCKEVKGKLLADWEWQQAAAEKDELMLKSIKQLIKHSIDGNDTSGLKEMESEIDDYLIKHQSR